MKKKNIMNKIYNNFVTNIYNINKYNYYQIQIIYAYN